MKKIAGSNLCTKPDDAEIVLRRLATAPKIVYDCETTGLNWRTDSIVGHVFTFGPKPADTYYVPVRHAGGGTNVGNIGDLDNAAFFDEALDQIFKTRPDLHMVGHHLIFDLMMLSRHGIGYRGTVEDTAVNATLQNEYAKAYNLAVCCVRAGVQEKKGDELYAHLATKYGGVPTRDQMGNYWRLRGDDPIGTEYAMGDGVSTWALWDNQIGALAAEDMEGIRRLESAVTRVVYRMMRRGVPIDEARLSEVHREARTLVDQAREALPDGFNVLAPSQIKKLLMDEGITNWPMTAPSKKFPNGQPQFNEAFLATNAPGKRIIAVRKYEHMIDTFVKPMMERHIWNDGCVHSTFNQARSDEYGTVTGRFSSNEPNLQQVPKRNYEIGSLVRSFFVPFEGELWGDADLSQCEPRLLAHYSGAKVLTEGYMSVPFVDAHQAVATAAEIDREDGKRLNQTLITGGGKGKIILMLGSRGADIYDAYFEAMPEVKTLQKNSSRRMETRGYVISMLKRRARLESRDKSYKAMNRLLQCGNADIVKLAMVRIDKYLEEHGDQVQMLNTVHDALGFSVPKDDDCKLQYDHCMRLFTDFGPGRSVEMRVPMAAEYAFGKNWAEASYPKKGDKVIVGADPNDPWYGENKVSMEDLW